MYICYSLLFCKLKELFWYLIRQNGIFVDYHQQILVDILSVILFVAPFYLSYSEGVNPKENVKIHNQWIVDYTQSFLQTAYVFNFWKTICSLQYGSIISPLQNCIHSRGIISLLMQISISFSQKQQFVVVLRKRYSGKSRTSFRNAIIETFTRKGPLHWCFLINFVKAHIVIIVSLCNSCPAL